MFKIYFFFITVVFTSNLMATYNRERIEDFEEKGFERISKPKECLGNPCQKSQIDHFPLLKEELSNLMLTKGCCEWAFGKDYNSIEYGKVKEGLNSSLEKLVHDNKKYYYKPVFHTDDYQSLISDNEKFEKLLIKKDEDLNYFTDGFRKGNELNKKLETKLEKFEIEHPQLENKVKGLEKDFFNSKDDNMNLTRENNVLKERNGKVYKENEFLKEEKSRLQNNYDLLEKESNSNSRLFKQDIEALQLKNSSLAEQMKSGKIFASNAIKTLNDDLENEEKRRDNQIASILQSKQFQIDDLKKENEHLKIKNDELIEKNNLIGKNYISFEKYQDLSNSFSKVLEQKERLQETVMDFEAKLNFQSSLKDEVRPKYSLKEEEKHTSNLLRMMAKLGIEYNENEINDINSTLLVIKNYFDLKD